MAKITQTINKKLTAAGTALLSIGIGLVSYGVDKGTSVIGIGSMAIGAVFVGAGSLAFVHVPATDTNEVAKIVRTIQADESKAEPYLVDYAKEIPKIIEEALNSQQGKIAGIVKDAIASDPTLVKQILDAAKSTPTNPDKAA
jgi:hypothetical protein